MVTKRIGTFYKSLFGLILAKIHMVTKLYEGFEYSQLGLILAKIHMVTKLASVTVD